MEHTCTCGCEHTEDYFTPFTSKEKRARQIYERLMSYARAIAFENPDFDPDEIEMEIASLLRKEAESGGEDAIKVLEKLIDDDSIREDILKILEEGPELGDDIAKAIRNRTNNIVEDFGSQVRELVRATLENSEALTAKEIKERLETVLPSGRASTIARNETIYAFQAGRMEQSTEIAQQYDLKMGVKWVAKMDGNTCDVCAAMNGTTTILGKSFKESIHFPSGHVLPNGRIVGMPPATATEEERKLYTGTNDFGWAQDMWSDYGTLPHCHVNCRCTFSEFVILDED